MKSTARPEATAAAVPAGSAAAASPPPAAAPPLTAVFTTLDTPDGPFSLLTAADGVLASGWTADRTALAALVHPTLRPAADTTEIPAGTGGPEPGGQRAADALAAARLASEAAAAVRDYYAGDHAAPDRIPVRQHSGEFRVEAWAALRRVGPGERLTYAAYAARAGRPTAVRAAAAACALNAAALFVPCHRILRTDGTLGGFRYGLELKQRLLDREAGSRPASTLF